MRKTLARSIMMIALSLPVAAANAQTAQPRNDNPNDPYTTTDRRNDTGKWGLLGLLGLVGLFGMKRADRTDRAATYRTNTASGTPVSR